MNTAYQTLEEIIRTRRSIFPASYIDKEISESTIQKILDSANYAPTHKLTQPWRFTVLRGAAKLNLGEELAGIYTEVTPENKFLQKKYDSIIEKSKQANCIIAVSMHLSNKVPEWEELAAVACAIQNMALTAHSLNIGSYWSSPSLIDHLTEFLELEDNEECICLFYMGYHQAVSTEANRTPIAEKVRWRSE